MDPLVAELLDPLAQTPSLSVDLQRLQSASEAKHEVLPVPSFQKDEPVVKDAALRGAASPPKDCLLSFLGSLDAVKFDLGQAASSGMSRERRLAEWEAIALKAGGSGEHMQSVDLSTNDYVCM
jgi:hypothetical protein